MVLTILISLLLLVSTARALSDTCSWDISLWPQSYSPDERLVLSSSENCRRIRERDQDADNTSRAVHRANDLWTSDPFCISDLCVLTDATFAAGRGVSFIATRKLAENVAKSKGYSSSYRTSHSNGLFSPKYEIRALPGRGLGLVANHTMVRGESIMVEPPVILAQHDLEDLLKEEEIGVLHRFAAERLPYQARKAAMRLHGYGGKDAAYDRFSANAFKVYDFAGLFPLVARMNHDCRPNAHYYFDKKTFTHRVHAIKTILPGQEVTISYLSHYLASDEREERTTQQWGFKCSCELCSSSHDTTTKSNNRLHRIQEIESVLENGSATNTGIADELVRLYKDEGLDAPIARAYRYAAQQYRMAGDHKRAKLYATHALNAAELWGGPWSQEVARINAVLSGL